MQKLEQSDPLVHDEAVRVPACCLCVRHGTARPLRETRARGWRRREGGGNFVIVIRLLFLTARSKRD